ncbi:enoyl-CoA hydratase-related protein [Mycolicibacterium sp. XJ1819]
MPTVLAVRDGAVLRLTLNRPDALNAVNTSMLRDLHGHLTRAGDDTAVRVVVLTGAGRAFCAGGDLTGVDTAGAAAAANDVVAAITALSKPVVAGVRGAAAGFGCPLALACDLVVAAESAFFQLAFAKVGLMPDGGASALLPVAIGRARASRMALLAEKITAATAFDWGMISHLVADDGYEQELESVIGALAGGPTRSYGWIKRALVESTLEPLTRSQTVETQGQAELIASADFRIGVTAFRNRTAPRFEGR